MHCSASGDKRLMLTCFPGGICMVRLKCDAANLCPLNMRCNAQHELIIGRDAPCACPAPSPPSRTLSETSRSPAVLCCA